MQARGPRAKVVGCAAPGRAPCSGVGDPDRRSSCSLARRLGDRHRRVGRTGHPQRRARRARRRAAAGGPSSRGRARGCADGLRRDARSRSAPRATPTRRPPASSGSSVDEPTPPSTAALDVGRDRVARRCARSTGSRRSSTAARSPLRVQGPRATRSALVLIAPRGRGRPPADRARRSSAPRTTSSASPAGSSGFALDAERRSPSRLLEAADDGRRPVSIVRTEPVEQPADRHRRRRPRQLADELTDQDRRSPCVVTWPGEPGRGRRRRPCGAGWAPRPGTDGLEVTVDEEKVDRRPRRPRSPGSSGRRDDASITLGRRRARSSPRARPAPAAATTTRGRRACSTPSTAGAVARSRSTVDHRRARRSPPRRPRRSASRSRSARPPSGRAVPQVKSFTTYHACCESRVTNIHRMADIVRGAIIPPGETFSINEHVGQRTVENGFVAAGAIDNGEHVRGGRRRRVAVRHDAVQRRLLRRARHSASTRATPMLLRPLPVRAARRRSGYPDPDLQIENNTPYGVLIWTDATPRPSITVHLYSTQCADGRADRPVRRGTQRQLHRWSPPPAPAPTSTAHTETDEVHAATTAPAKASTADGERRSSVAVTAGVTDGRHALRAPDERRRRAHVDDREGPAAAVDDHRRRRPRPGARPRPAARRASTGAPGSSPGCASGCVGNPLSIAPPRWEVDPNFDLDFHLRFVRAGRRRHRCATCSTSPSRSPCRASTGPGRCGRSRRRGPRGRPGRRSILKVHHAITDGVGGVKLAMHLFDLERDGGRPRRACPTAPAGARA